MNNDEELLKNYFESLKRQKEILEATKKRNLKNDNLIEPLEEDYQSLKEAKKEASITDHENQINSYRSKHLSRDANEELSNKSDIDLPSIKKDCFSFKEASAKLKEALDNEYYLKRALNRFEKNDFKRAINDFTRAIRINPEKIDIYLLRANAKIKCEQFRKAIEDLNLYLQSNSNNINAFLDRGDCYLKLGSKELALKDYDEANLLGSKIGLEKKTFLEPVLKKNKKLIEDLSKKIKRGTKDHKIYFSRAMAYKKEEGCDYELVINDLNKCIDLYPYYEDAYHELREAKTILSDKYSQEEISSDQEKYYSFKNKLISSQLHEAYSVQRQALLNEIDQKIKNNPLNSEILLHLIKNLEGKYTEEQIGIASGYFYKSGQLKFLDKDKFLKAKTKIVNTIDVEDNSKYSSLLRYASEFCIFKQRFCFIDSEHGGRVYIPSRIVNESKTWDYSKTKFKDYNLDNLIKDEKEFYYFFDETRVKRIVEEQIKKHSFNEPMQYINVKQYWYLDESLQTCERLENEEIAEFHGIKYEDCDSWSSWCEETEFSM